MSRADSENLALRRACDELRLEASEHRIDTLALARLSGLSGDLVDLQGAACHRNITLDALRDEVESALRLENGLEKDRQSMREALDRQGRLLDTLMEASDSMSSQLATVCEDGTAEQQSRHLSR